MRRLFVLFLALAVLAGCGSTGSTTRSFAGDNPGGGSDAGGGGGNGGNGGGGNGGGTTDPPSAFNIQSSAHKQTYIQFTLPEINQILQDSQTGPHTVMGDIPDNDPLIYQGYLRIGFGNPGEATLINGDATLEVDVAQQLVTGSADNFEGFGFVESGSEELIAYEGDAPISFSSGTVALLPSEEAVVSLNIAGTLNNGVTTYVIAGALEGSIYGTAADGLFLEGSASQFRAGDMTVLIGSESAGGTPFAVLSMMRQP